MTDSNVKYHQNVLNGFDNGCLLDLRVRLAIEFLKSPMFHNAIPEDTGSVDEGHCAAIALNIAEELLEQAEARGWIEPLPDTADLNSQTIKQAKRTGAWQVYQQIGANNAAKKEQDRVQVPPIAGVRN